MEDEYEKTLKDQMRKLPKEVADFILSSSWDTDTDEIGALYNLSAEEVSGFKREVTLVLVGLVHPDAFMETLKQEVGIKGAVLEALVLNVEKKIFTPIRPALISFFEKESASSKQGVTPETTAERPTPEAKEEAPAIEAETLASSERKFTSPFSAIIEPTPVRTWGKEPEIVPDNLPTQETAESFLPNLTPKTTSVEETPTPATPQEPAGHPFEEKMKKVFTAGQQSMGDLTIEPATPKTEERKAPPIYHTDPYREPIE